MAEAKYGKYIIYFISPLGLGAGTNRTKLKVTEADGTYETKR